MKTTTTKAKKIEINPNKTYLIMHPEFNQDTPVNVLAEYAQVLVEQATIQPSDPAYAKELVQLLRDFPQILQHKTPTPRRDNLTYISTLRNIPEVRRLKKIAYAKISKSKDKPEAVDRYRKEVAQADEVLNQLLAEIAADKTPWKKALELGEDEAAAFNYFLQDYKDKIDDELKELAKAKNLTNAEVKAELQKTKLVIPTAVPKELREAMAERIKRGDQMVQTVAKKAAYIKALKA